LVLSEKGCLLGTPVPCRQLIGTQPIDAGKIPALPGNIYPAIPHAIPNGIRLKSVHSGDSNLYVWDALTSVHLDSTGNKKITKLIENMRDNTPMNQISDYPAQHLP
jgi:hypothetical protein